MGKVFCSNTEKAFQGFFFSSSLRNSKEAVWHLYSHQHMEGRKQVVHREVRKTKVR